MLCLCSFACSVCVRSLGGLEKCVGKCWYMGRVLEFVQLPAPPPQPQQTRRAAAIKWCILGNLGAAARRQVLDFGSNIKKLPGHGTYN